MMNRAMPGSTGRNEPSKNRQEAIAPAPAKLKPSSIGQTMRPPAVARRRNRGDTARQQAKPTVHVSTAMPQKSQKAANTPAI